MSLGKTRAAPVIPASPFGNAPLEVGAASVAGAGLPGRDAMAWVHHAREGAGVEFSRGESGRAHGQHRRTPVGQTKRAPRMHPPTPAKSNGMRPFSFPTENRRTGPGRQTYCAPTGRDRERISSPTTAPRPPRPGARAAGQLRAPTGGIHPPRPPASQTSRAPPPGRPAGGPGFRLAHPRRPRTTGGRGPRITSWHHPTLSDGGRARRPTDAGTSASKARGIIGLPVSAHRSSPTYSAVRCSPQDARVARSAASS